MKKKLYDFFVRFLLRNKRVKKSSTAYENISCVCFFSNTAIGDTLFNTPVFRAFRAKFNHVKIIAILNPRNAVLFRDDPNLDEIIEYNGRWGGFWHTLRTLKNKKIDVCFLLHSNEPQATPLAVLAGAKYVFKLPNLMNKFNIWHSNAPQSYELPNRYIVLNRLLQLVFVGIKSVDTRLNLYLNESDYARVDNVLMKKNSCKIIGFQMGASSRSRKWTLQRWCELAILILRYTDYKIVLTGSLSEKSETIEFENELKQRLVNNLAEKRNDVSSSILPDFGERVLNLAGVFNLREASALIDRLDLLITPDTGPLHIAAAMKTPTIALFGIANPISSNPDFDVNIHDFIKVEHKASKFDNKHGDFSALMSKISAREVYEKMEKLL